MADGKVMDFIRRYVWRHRAEPAWIIFGDGKVRVASGAVGRYAAIGLQQTDDPQDVGSIAGEGSNDPRDYDAVLVFKNTDGLDVLIANLMRARDHLIRAETCE